MPMTCVRGGLAVALLVCVAVAVSLSLLDVAKEAAELESWELDSDLATTAVVATVGSSTEEAAGLLDSRLSPVWASLSRGMRFPEGPAAALESSMLPPATPQLCFLLCGEKVCQDALAASVAAASARAQASARKRQTKGNRNSVNPYFAHAACGAGVKRWLPYYFAVGYSQAGSTFFSRLLGSHPRVALACRKEVHFFDQALYRKMRARAHVQHIFSLDRYADCFAGLDAGEQRRDSVVGDMTVKMIYADVWLPVWARAVNPRLKLVVLLRDPVQRALSRFHTPRAGGQQGCHHGGGGTGGTGGTGESTAQGPQGPQAHSKSEGKAQTETKADTRTTTETGTETETETETTTCSSFDEYALATLDRIGADPACAPLREGDPDPSAVYRCAATPFKGRSKLDADTLVSGAYAKHVKHWLNFFPAEQFLFVQSERLFAAPVPQMQRVARFLELPAFEEVDLAHLAAVARHNKHAAGAGAGAGAEGEGGGDLGLAGLRPATLQRLCDFYAGFNRELLDLLGDLGRADDVDESLWTSCRVG